VLCESEDQAHLIESLDRVIEAGNEFGHDFAGIKQMLPRACRHSKLVQVSLGS